MADYTKLHEDKDWVINIEDNPKDNKQVIVTYKMIDGTTAKAYISKSPIKTKDK
jgi:hypothetical protein